MLYNMKHDYPPARYAVTPEKSLKFYRFREFTYAPASGELRRGGQLISLRPRAALALNLLLSRPGEIVSCEEFRAAIWAGAILEWRDGLHQIIRELRKALNDNSKNPIFIETVSRRGYCFFAKVRPVRSGAPWKFFVGKREAAFFGAGLLSLPLLILAVCAAAGVGG